MYNWTRATSKPSPISNGRILVCVKMSEDIRLSTVTTDPRRRLAVVLLALAMVHLLPLVTTLHTKIKEVILAMVMPVVDIAMVVEAEESRPTMDRLLTIMALSQSKAGEYINTFLCVYDTISKLTILVYIIHLIKECIHLASASSCSRPYVSLHICKGGF